MLTGAALLATMALFIPATPPPACASVIPVLAVDRPLILAGNFRDTDGNCYVWLNVRYRWWRTRVCNTVSHELAHLNGREHPIPRDRSCHA